MLHIPVLRAGAPYRSLTVARVSDFRTGEPLAEVSQANSGLIAKDLMKVKENQRKLAQSSIPELVAICQKAAGIFLEGELSVGDQPQSADDYVNQVSATTGMPKVMCRRNMNKIATAMEKMPEVLRGLTRGADLEKLHLDFRRETAALGAILPSNSPGVHSLWLPSLALQTPLVLKPGSREPWSPYRIAMALYQAGLPREGISYYPTDVNGTREVLLRCGKSMFFGDKKTVEAWKGENRVQIHGPGWSKVLVGADKADHWQDYLGLMAESVAANGGRSCINASGVWTAARGREIAEGLAERLASVEARDMDDPQAQICAFTNKKIAEMLNRRIESELQAGGAEDLTAKYRGGERLVEVGGCAFLLPTVIWCDDPDHPLARAEYLFPFCAVVETPQDELAERIEATLVATVLSEDAGLVDALMDADNIDRINVGPLPTNAIRWDQPHEGNLFELLHHQRAVQHHHF